MDAPVDEAQDSPRDGLASTSPLLRFAVARMSVVLKSLGRAIHWLLDREAIHCRRLLCWPDEETSGLLPKHLARRTGHELPAGCDRDWHLLGWFLEFSDIRQARADTVHQCETRWLPPMLIWVSLARVAVLAMDDTWTAVSAVAAAGPSPGHTAEPTTPKPRRTRCVLPGVLNSSRFRSTCPPPAHCLAAAPTARPPVPPSADQAAGCRQFGRNMDGSRPCESVGYKAMVRPPVFASVLWRQRGPPSRRLNDGPASGRHKTVSQGEER